MFKFLHILFGWSENICPFQAQYGENVNNEFLRYNSFCRLKRLVTWPKKGRQISLQLSDDNEDIILDNRSIPTIEWDITNTITIMLVISVKWYPNVLVNDLVICHKFVHLHYASVCNMSTSVFLFKLCIYHWNCQI